MKAPNKIYIHEGMLGLIATEKRVKKSDTAYIRKDALLWWAKEAYLNENASAIRKVCYKQLIDKIESL